MKVTLSTDKDDWLQRSANVWLSIHLAVAEATASIYRRLRGRA